jgi:hypothetical protein
VKSPVLPPKLQDPTACSGRAHPQSTFHSLSGCTDDSA